MSQPYKICPRCQTPADLQAPSCGNCGRVYKTQFPQNPDRTVVGAGQTAPNDPAIYQQPQPPPYEQPTIYQPGYQHPPPAYTPKSDWIQLPPGSHSAGLALLFSLLITGGGQIYNRQFVKGAVVLVGYMALIMVLWVLAVITFGLGLVFFLVLVPVWIVLSVDAYKVAERLNRGEAIGQWQSF
jgi:hypothetical protein